MDIDKIKQQLKKLTDARDWHQFHTPKNLAMSVSIEAAELLEHFQWLTAEQSTDVKNDEQKKHKVGEEIADVFIYLLMLADKLDIDAEQAIHDKIRDNEKRFCG